MKTIVYYYTHSGSNRYLANKIAADLKCQVEELRPRLNVHLFMLLGLNFGNKKIQYPVENYDRVIVCGPIWMGKLITPLKNFVIDHVQKIKELVFVTCCGSTFEKKDEKFGYNLVFNKLKTLLGQKCKLCQAFPINLVIPQDQKDDSNLIMKTRLNDTTFKGEIDTLYQKFIQDLS